MALPERDAICRGCHHPFRAKPKRDFLGFQRFTCPNCSKPVMYPLTSGYRVTYWILVGLMTMAIVAAFAEGSYGFPGLIGIAMIWALAKDYSIRKDVAAAERSAQPANSPTP